MADLNSIVEALPVHDGADVIANFDRLAEKYPAGERVGCDHCARFRKGSGCDLFGRKFASLIVE